MANTARGAAGPTLIAPRAGPAAPGGDRTAHDGNHVQRRVGSDFDRARRWHDRLLGVRGDPEIVKAVFAVDAEPRFPVEQRAVDRDHRCRPLALRRTTREAVA